MLFKTVDWNALSQMGLIERINREILHPLGLAMARDVVAGISPYAVIAPDGHWAYESNRASLIKPDDEVRRMIEAHVAATNQITYSGYRRFIVFAFKGFYPAGGMDDTSPDQSFNSQAEAEAWISNQPPAEPTNSLTYQILDTDLRIMITVGVT